MLQNLSEKPVDLRAWAAALSQEIAVLKSEIQRSQAALSEAEEKSVLVHRLLVLDGQSPDVEAVTGEDEHKVPRTVTVDSLDTTTVRGHDLEGAVEAILEEAGSPLHVSDIRLRLIENGVQIPGRGDDANVIVRIRKAPERFTRTARGTYALASWGLPSLDTRVAKRKRSRSAP